MIKKFISQIPPVLGEYIQYYCRRGNKFYFRTPCKKKKMFIVVNPNLIDKVKSDLEFGKIYVLDLKTT